MNAKADERLRHDHAELGDLLNQLNAALEANDIAQTHAALDLCWARLAVHIRAEHLHLFPMISRAAGRVDVSNKILPPGEPENTIAKLRDDHDLFMRELAQAIAITRGLSAMVERDATAQLEEVNKKLDAVSDRLVRHNEIEETGIYLWTSSLLGEAERTELASQVQKELDNLPPRFGV
jgi:hemerythrin-like domain-containing protein